MSAHLDVAHLLEAREGRAGAAARDHLASCGSCRRALEDAHQLRARLRALPELSAPRDRWPAVREALRAERRRLRHRRLLRGSIAAAGLLALVWAGSVATERSSRERETFELRGRLAELREQSQLLDAELRALAAGATTSLQAEALLVLEDGLRDLDRELDRELEETSEPAREPSGLESEIALWEHRLDLQSAMVQVHHTSFRVGAL